MRRLIFIGAALYWCLGSLRLAHAVSPAVNSTATVTISVIIPYSVARPSPVSIVSSAKQSLLLPSFAGLYQIETRPLRGDAKDRRLVARGDDFKLLTISQSGIVIISPE